MHVFYLHRLIKKTLMFWPVRSQEKSLYCCFFLLLISSMSNSNNIMITMPKLTERFIFNLIAGYVFKHWSNSCVSSTKQQNLTANTRMPQDCIKQEKDVVLKR